mmetsp:Transcript_81087/g.194531  ORF Transcript_81087/g.194531 Transcript_81087/m.194531 type:complete len:738 (+) Transcript_81087:91-2304(+)
MVPFLLSIAAVLSLGGADSSLDILGEEENQLSQRRLDFEAWCKQEVENQEAQRKQLLQQKVTEPELQRFEVPAALVELEQQLRVRADKTAEVSLKSLRAFESELSSQSHWLFGESRSLQAVRRLRQEAQQKLSLSQTSRSRAELEAEMELLKAQARNRSEALAADYAKALAARSRREVLKAALAQTDAALSETSGICGLGRSVLNRTEVAGKALVRKALELIGMVEAGAEAPVPMEASRVNKDPGQSALLEQLLQQQHLMQQQIQQMELKTPKEVELPRLEPLKAMGPDSLADLATAPSPVKEAAKSPMSLAAEAKQISPHATASKQPDRPTNAKSTDALSADANLPVPSKAASTEASSVEISHVRDEPVRDPREPPAPKDFPAALRGGWQALLAKKRSESKGKKVAKPDDSSTIMELMQTPQTYTAWQPDKGAAQPDKAKEDLMAAEKAFEEDEDDSARAGKKKDAKSFLQLDGNDLGPDPLAFFQLGSAHELRGPFAAPAPEVAQLLGKFAEASGSTMLLGLSKAQLDKKDLALMLQKMQAEPDDQPAQLCQRLEKESRLQGVASELKHHFALAKARAMAAVLKRETAARKSIAAALSSSHRFLGAQNMLQLSFERERERLQRVKQLPWASVNSRGAAQELQGVLEKMLATAQHAEEELQDALASASSRPIPQLEGEPSDASDAAEAEAEAATQGPGSEVARLCALEYTSRATRQEMRSIELAAIQAAAALAELE